MGQTAQQIVTGTLHAILQNTRQDKARQDFTALHTLAAPRPNISTVPRSISPSAPWGSDSSRGLKTASGDSSANRGERAAEDAFALVKDVAAGAKASVEWAATARTAKVATRDRLGMVINWFDLIWFDTTCVDVVWLMLIRSNNYKVEEGDAPVSRFSHIRIQDVVLFPVNVVVLGVRIVCLTK